MSELLSKLGIDWKLLIAQIINFLILLFVLYRFAYEPILAMLEKRQKKIEKGLADADEAHRKLKESEEKQKEMLRKARMEAKKIVEKSHIQAEKSKSEILAESREQSEKMISDAKAEIEREKQKTIAEIKSEIGGLIVAAAEKMIGEKIDDKRDKKIIEEVMK